MNLVHAAFIESLPFVCLRLYFALQVNVPMLTCHTAYRSAPVEREILGWHEVEVTDSCARIILERI